MMLLIPTCPTFEVYNFSESITPIIIDFKRVKSQKQKHFDVMQDA